MRLALALKLQQKLAKKVIICPFEKLTYPSAKSPSSLLIAATDLGIRKDSFTAAIAVYELTIHPDRSPKLNLVEETVHVGDAKSIRFPYVPGFLSFREIPPLLQAFKKLTVSPDVILCDGQGIAHPRRIGLASHLGVILKKPSVGCAKNKLCGTHALLPTAKGSWVDLLHEGQTLGVVYRSKTGVKPIYISPGHLIDIPSSIALVEMCLGKYRIPDPLRRAHALTKA
ncbi:MAG: endonuclease V [Thermodesulforhabdaceae bacterium]